VRTETLFLCLLFSGIAALIGGLLLTRFHWRPDIPPYGRRTRSLHVIVHPERYVTDAPLTAIRILTAAGSLLLAGAVGVVAYELLRTTVRR
jgi:hypothetical protein